MKHTDESMGLDFREYFGAGRTGGRLCPKIFGIGRERVKKGIQMFHLFLRSQYMQTLPFFGRHGKKEEMAYVLAMA